MVLQSSRQRKQTRRGRSEVKEASRRLSTPTEKAAIVPIAYSGSPSLRFDFENASPSGHHDL